MTAVLPDLAAPIVAAFGERLRQRWPAPPLTDEQWDRLDEAVTLATDAAVAAGYDYAIASMPGLVLSRVMRERRRMVELRCASCGQAFAAHARGPADAARYCSTACRSRASNARRRAKATPKN